jgi:hypothetical protein
MNISKEKVYDVLHIQTQDIPETNWVWEISLQLPDRPWTQKDVEKLQDQLAGYEDFEYYKEDEVLEVHTSEGNLILEIQGLLDISRYCDAEHFENIPHTWHDIVELSHSSIKDHYMINFESMILQKKQLILDETAMDWKELGKYFYQKKVLGYLHKKSGVRYAMEFIRGTNDAYPSMRDASLGSTKLEIILKIIMTHENNVKNKLQEILKHMMFLYQELADDKYPLVKEDQEKILKKYLQLISSSRDLNKYEQMNPKNFFLAPKPITLEQKNLVDPDTAVGVTSILRNYAVTDKADGERMLLFVDDKGDCYLINNTYQVRKTGIVAKSKAVYNTLLDGEYVLKHQMKNMEKDEFAIFDIYYIGGENVMKLPLIASTTPSRYAKMELVLDTSYWDVSGSDVVLEMKKHIAADGKDMFLACKNILEDKKRKYEIDGLIFTPADLPVFGYYPNQYKKTRGAKVGWEKVFKWKPPTQNTIDFLVEEQEGFFVEEKTNKKYKRFKLYVGYNASQWEETSVWKGLQKVYSKDSPKEGEDEYEAKLFKPIQNYHPNVSIAFIPVNAAGQAITENNEVVDTDTIVEMSYTPDVEKHPSLRWSATRIREDKTRAYRMEREKMLKDGSKTTQKRLMPSKTANDLSVALNIWQSIHAPVTVEHIIGQQIVPVSALPADIEERMLGTNDVYYARDIPRNHMLSVNMLNFHTHGIKSMLYASSPGKDMLLELACGKAGDLPRWRDHHYNFILGVDLVKNNIEASDGSYARYLNQRREYYKRNQRGPQRIFYPQAVFVVGDCSLPLETGEAAKSKDYDSEMLLKMLYQGKMYDKYGFLNNFRIPGKASRKFDVVSCQFAVHYFFKTKERLEGFLRNVSYNLKPQGRFIATFMDGQKVHALIHKQGKVEGRKGPRGDMVWAIQKQYKSFTKASPYGKLIDVYLENTNQFIPEFLVHFDILKEKAREFQLEVLEDGFFETTFHELYRKVMAEDPTRNKFLDQDIMALHKDQIQTEFSFLNRWVIFRKMDPAELAGI